MCGEIWWLVSRRVAPENLGPFRTICRVPARSAGKFGAFYSVSDEIPARSAGKFWGTCVASVKFCNLVFNDLALSYTYRSVGDTPTRGRKALRGTFLSV
eukprot:scaffold107246_cov36-Phaeocystis_antarctica.AAC.1